LVGNTWRTKVVANDHTHWRAQGLFAYLFIAAPMVGASPDNIGAKRPAEGGVPASGAGSATKNEWLGTVEARPKKIGI
jgi:hypothetical protein